LIAPVAGRYDHHRHRRQARIAPHPGDQLLPAHAGHHQVGDEAVEGLLAEAFQGAAGVGLGLDLPRRVGLAEGIGHQQGDLGFVVDHEDARLGVGAEHFGVCGCHSGLPFSGRHGPPAG